MSVGLVQPPEMGDIEIEVEEDFLKPRPPSADDEMDITPMIDITFLLLIFFIVSSKMNAEQAVELPQARHGGVVAAKESVVIVMKRGTGDLAEVLKADGTAFSPDAEQQNAEIAEYVAQGIDAGKKHVIIRAEGSVRHGEIGRVSEAISESIEEGEVINIAVMEQT
ncbi:MAG: biopolymer transporter ExbD [Pirellulaceae bacterium]